MKKLFFALIALSLSACFCSGLVGCTIKDNPPELVKFLMLMSLQII